MNPVCFLMLIVVVVSTALANGFGQTTGTPPFGSFGGGPFDVVNLANLNAHFMIPVVNKAGRGTPFIYNIAYDSTVWTPSGGAWVQALNWGWTAQTAASFGYVTKTTGQSPCFDPDFGTIIQHNERYKAYYDPFGTRHLFLGVFVTDGACGGPETATATARDGSGYTMSATFGESPTVTSRDGAKVTPPVNSTSGAGTYTDTNGNQITGTGSSFIDTLAGCGKTPTEPRMILVSTTQPDKKKVCVEKMSSSWMCSAT